MTEADLPPIPVPPSLASDPGDSSPGQEPVPAAETTLSTVDAPPIDKPPKRWYWGVAEALLWFFGALAVHIVGGFSLLVILIIARAVSTGQQPAATIDSETLLIVTAGEMFCFVVVSVLAVSIRYWGRTFRELNLSLPETRHVVIVLGGTLPLSLCVSAWSEPIQWGWKYVKQVVPALEILDGMNAMEMVKEMAQSTSLPIMLLIVALMPAIGEELVFRGAMGRVLIECLGIWAGVILTSILFGCVHVHPVHALSVIPLGLAMHVIYLWTRSFWMPMLLHFLNNSWASILLQSGMDEAEVPGIKLSLINCVQMGSAVIAVIFLTIALRQSRVRWFREDGQEWISLRYPVRNPPIGEYQRKEFRIDSVYWFGALVCVVVCHLAVVADLIAS